MENIMIEVAIGLMLVAIGGILLLIALMYCLFKRRIDEMHCDLQQLKLNFQSMAYSFRKTIGIIEKLATLMEEKPNDQG